MNLQFDATVATIISSVAVVASALFVVVQLRQAARDRYFTITIAFCSRSGRVRTSGKTSSTFCTN